MLLGVNERYLYAVLVLAVVTGALFGIVYLNQRAEAVRQIVQAEAYEVNGTVYVILRNQGDKPISSVGLTIICQELIYVGFPTAVVAKEKGRFPITKTFYDPVEPGETIGFPAEGLPSCKFYGVRVNYIEYTDGSRVYFVYRNP